MNRMRLVHRDSLSCEPILRRMPNGDLLCVSQCGDVTEPAPGNRVYVFRSTDEGENWSAPELIRPEDGRAVYLTEVTVIGQRIIVYLTYHNGSFVDWTGDRMESTDNGHTWHSIGPLPGFETYTFPRGSFRLKNGLWLMLCQHYPVDEAENTRLREKGLRWKDAQIDRVENDVLLSADEGQTWQRFAGPVIPIKGETGRPWVWSEPTAVELKDGRIVMFLRVCGSGRLYRSESTDGGKHFSPAVPTEIPNPANKPKLLRLEDGRIALIHTPCAVQGFKGRNPLSIWLSDDELDTFGDLRVISDFPGAFCYPDGFSEGSHIHFTIEYNRHDILYVDADVSKEGE